jgi:hypothetical protein
MLVSTNGKKSKKVRFNDNVKYKTYKKNSFDTPDSSDMDNLYNKTKIDVDSIFSSARKNTLSDSSSASNNKISSASDRSIVSSSNSSIHAKPYFKNNNLYSHDPISETELWDTNFGLPLMNKDEKKKFISKMQKNHQDYQKSLGKFSQYQMDNDTVIKTDTTINPFKSDERGNSLKGRTVKEIYDQQVRAPKAKSKKIKQRSDSEIEYENEVEMNGGKIKGTDMCGFDSTLNDFHSAAFGNEF